MNLILLIVGICLGALLFLFFLLPMVTFLVVKFAVAAYFIEKQKQKATNNQEQNNAIE